jgi:hypothetical protein
VRHRYQCHGNAVVVSIAMAPMKKKKGHEGPRDTRHRKTVFSAGTSPIKSPSSTAARRAATASSSNSRSNSSTRSSASVARGYKSPPEIEILDSDDEDTRADPRVYEAGFSLDPQRVLSAYSRGSGLNDEVMEEVMITSAIIRGACMPTVLLLYSNIASFLANIHSFSTTVRLHQQVHYRRILRYQRQGG